MTSGRRTGLNGNPHELIVNCYNNRDTTLKKVYTYLKNETTSGSFYYEGRQHHQIGKDWLDPADNNGLARWYNGNDTRTSSVNEGYIFQTANGSLARWRIYPESNSDADSFGEKDGLIPI